MLYYVCDLINADNGDIVKKFLYGIACDRLKFEKPEWNMDQHMQYIIKYIRHYAANRKTKPKHLGVKIYKAEYKDVVKMGYNFKTFHPPDIVTGGREHPEIKGKASANYDEYAKYNRKGNQINKKKSSN